MNISFHIIKNISLHGIKSTYILRITDVQFVWKYSITNTFYWCRFKISWLKKNWDFCWQDLGIGNKKRFMPFLKDLKKEVLRFLTCNWANRQNYTLITPSTFSYITFYSLKWCSFKLPVTILPPKYIALC